MNLKKITDKYGTPIVVKRRDNGKTFMVESYDSSILAVGNEGTKLETFQARLIEDYPHNTRRISWYDTRQFKVIME